MPAAILSSDIQTGIIIARKLEGVIWGEEPFWIDSRSLGFRIIINIDISPNEFIPNPSEWVLVVSDDYPLGTVKIYPSKTNSIKVTFEHQSFNRPNDYSKLPHNDGSLCLTSGRLFSETLDEIDPIGNAEERIRWYLKRTLAWIKAADDGQLVKPNEPFELPHYPVTDRFRWVIHDESCESFDCWNTRNLKSSDWGLIVFEVEKRSDITLFIAREFKDPKKNLIRSTLFSRGIPKKSSRSLLGAWWLWPRPIISAPWQVPRTWGDLERMAKEANIDYQNILRQISAYLRKGKESFLLFGYPIPRKKNGPNIEIHWQGVSISYPRTKQKHSYQEEHAWRHDKTYIYSSFSTINYTRTENWHSDRLQARGRLSGAFRHKRVVIIGCGALGGVIAELILRGGVEDCLLIDGEKLVQENLVRHPLSGEDVFKNKAQALAEKMRSVCPSARIEYRSIALEGNVDTIARLLDDSDIILDCTAETDVIKKLSLPTWSFPRLFISLSLGYKARRAFIFAYYGCSFPEETFDQCICEYLKKERLEYAEAMNEELFAGAGCWSPLFPAQFADIMIMAGACLKTIEELLEMERFVPHFIVYEQSGDSNRFIGLRRHEVLNHK